MHSFLTTPCWFLHLQEGDDYEVVPGTEFTVTRTANRNNTSDYYINNKRVSVKEVTTMLKEKGIDLDNNRFLILQVRAHASQRRCCRSPSIAQLAMVGWQAGTPGLMHDAANGAVPHVRRYSARLVSPSVSNCCGGKHRICVRAATGLAADQPAAMLPNRVRWSRSR